MWGQLEALKLLLKFGGDPSILDAEDKDAFALAEENEETKIMVYLDYLRMTTIIPNVSSFNETFSSEEGYNLLTKSDNSWSKPFNFHKAKEPLLDVCQVNDSANDEFSQTCDDKDKGFIASPASPSSTIDDSTVTRVSNNIHSLNLDSLDDIESIHSDEYTGAELVERLSSCCPSVISVNSSDLDYTDETEVYDWRSYRHKKPDNDDMQQLIMKSLAGGDHGQMALFSLPGKFWNTFIYSMFFNYR